MLPGFRNFRCRLRALFHPDMYHGWGKKRNYFEGWYFKIVDATEQYAFAFIPGISFDAGGRAHAFIQVMDGKKKSAVYHDFPAQAFVPDADFFHLNLDKNQFSASGFSLDLPAVQGNISFRNTTPWPKMLGAPGVMGWFSFVPLMECKHGVVSLFHRLAGGLTVNGDYIDFSGGIGYVEKDWGQSFPAAYIWLQCNHFNTAEPISLMTSVAKIPYAGTYFIGFLVGFYFDNKLYRFATYTGAGRTTRIDGQTVYLTFQSGKNRLEITATQSPGTDLISPLPHGMAGKVNESLEATVELQFYKNGKLVFSDTGRNAGMEIAGSVQELEK